MDLIAFTPKDFFSLDLCFKIVLTKTHCNMFFFYQTLFSKLLLRAMKSIQKSKKKRMYSHDCQMTRLILQQYIPLTQKYIYICLCILPNRSNMLPGPIIRNYYPFIRLPAFTRENELGGKGFYQVQPYQTIYNKTLYRPPNIMLYRKNL